MPHSAHLTATQRERRGLWLGLLGVLLFALTLPMTRLAVGAASDPQLPPLFVTAGRAALAGVLSALYLVATRAPRPRVALLGTFATSALGTVVGFPLFTGLALRQVDAMHAAVITGLMPLATAVAAAIHFRQRPSNGFWACAATGCALVIVFALLQGSGRLNAADGLLLLAVACTAVGYVAGAQLASQMRAEQVICWVLVLSLPVSLPAALLTWPELPVRAASWGGFAYVSVFSMWLGFFAWYRGLALGGTVRVSQVQLVQPFLSMLFAVPLLGERLDMATVVFALAVIATVFIGKKMPADLRSAA
jgi:drug/metabolite transporter (DMT)-like permease